MISIQSRFGGSPQPPVRNTTEPLLNILIDRIANIPFEGYFVAYDVPELPTDADDFWRIKYTHISGDDYLITAVRVWGDDIYTRRMNAFSRIWKSEKWEELINSSSLARKAMIHGAIEMSDYSTVLEMALSVMSDTSVFAYQGSALSMAADDPLSGTGAEFQYLILMDHGPRRTVVAIQYLPANGIIRTWKRQLYEGSWKQDSWTEDITSDDLADKISKGSEKVALGTDILTLGPGRYFVDGITTETEAMNLPVAVWHHDIIVYASENKMGLTQNYKIIEVFPVGVPTPYINQMDYDGRWTGWHQITMDISPLRHDLPLLNDLIDNNCSYRKRNDGELTLSIDILREAFIPTNVNISVLPIGFRPYQHEVRPIYLCDPNGNPNGYAHLHLYPDGIIVIHGVLVENARTAFTDCRFWTENNPMPIQSQVHLPADSPMLLTATEPAEKCMCVVDKDNRYVEFALTTMTPDRFITVHNYSLGEGERLVDAPPPIKYLRDVGKLSRPIWDEATSAWLETEG